MERHPRIKPVRVKGLGQLITKIEELPNLYYWSLDGDANQLGKDHCHCSICLRSFGTRGHDIHVMEHAESEIEAVQKAYDHMTVVLGWKSMRDIPWMKSETEEAEG